MKTKAVLLLPKSTSTKDVKSFLGLIGYLRKFIHSYPTIGQLLIDLLKHNGKLNFGPDERAVFTQIKNILHLNLSFLFIIPMPKLRFTAMKLEVIAVIEALKIFCIYVFGIPFKTVNDCKVFKMTIEKRDMCPKIARWIFILSKFNYAIENAKVLLCVALMHQVITLLV